MARRAITAATRRRARRRAATRRRTARRRRRRRRCRRGRDRRGHRFGRDLGLLGRRCHGRHHEVAGDRRTGVLGALQVLPAHRVVEVQIGEVRGELLGDMLRLSIDLHRVADHVQHAAALEARAQPVIVEMHRHRHADRLAGREALEIDVLRRVADRMELHVADQRARRIAVHLDLVEARLPAGPVQFAQHRAGVQRDEAGLLPRPVDDTGHLALTPGRPRRPLTGSRACLGLDGHDISHGPLLQMQAPASRGAGVARGLAEGGAEGKQVGNAGFQSLPRRRSGECRGGALKLRGLAPGPRRVLTRGIPRAIAN